MHWHVRPEPLDARAKASDIEFAVVGAFQLGMRARN